MLSYLPSHLRRIACFPIILQQALVRIMSVVILLHFRHSLTIYLSQAVNVQLGIAGITSMCLSIMMCCVFFFFLFSFAFSFSIFMSVCCAWECERMFCMCVSAHGWGFVCSCSRASLASQLAWRILYGCHCSWLLWLPGISMGSRGLELQSSSLCTTPFNYWAIPSAQCAY